jgi:biotin carboxyl carrier protein
MKDFAEISPGVWSVLDGDRSYDVRVSGNEVRVNGRAVNAEFVDPREWNLDAARGAVQGSAQVRAAMPGKVVRVLVSPGDEVTAGQSVVIIEAMKMQNELKSPRDGRVTIVSTRENDAVNAGTVLVTIE